MSRTTSEKQSDMLTTISKNLNALDSISEKMLNEFNYKNNMIENNMKECELYTKKTMTGGKNKKKHSYK